MDLRNEISRLTEKCIQCRRCTKVCPSASKGGIIPHEVMASSDGDVSTCIMCGNCNRICKKTEPMTVMKMLRYIWFNGNFGDSYERYGFTMPPSKIDVPKPEWDDEGITVMSGCVVKCIAPYLEYAATSALRSMGFKRKPMDNESCCLRPPMFANMHKEQRIGIRKDMLPQDSDLLCLCTGCADEMGTLKGENVDTIEFLYLNMDRLPKANKTLRLAVETGCEATGERDKVTAILERMDHIDIGNKMGCCGKDTPVAALLMEDREAEIADADAVVVICPKCFTEYDKYEGGRPVIYIMELVSMAFGDRTTLQDHRIPVP